MCRIALLLLILPLTACAQEPEPADSASAVESAASTAAPGSTAADHAGGSEPDPELIAACMEQTNMGDEVCTCVARKARAELTEKEHTFLLATVRGDEEESERLRGDLAVEEAMRAGMFMVNAPRECAGG